MQVDFFKKKQKNSELILVKVNAQVKKSVHRCYLP